MHEALLYVGCTSSYDRRAQKIALALVKLLRAADVEFGYLGEEEPCCGEAALNLGHHRYFEELAQQASKVFHDRGVGRVITISPHCFDVFANHLHEMGDDFQPQHYTQALAELIQRGRLTFAKALDLKVTFNDPCFLGRRNNIYDPPREILSTIPRVSLVEMENYRGEALCCGGGGGRMWMETPAGERFSDLRVREAIATGAEILATACPFCIVCLEDSLKGLRSNEIAVLDVAELAALALH
jgi:Fe-S oxidoreductase